MVSIDENIKVLSRAVLSDVQGDAEQILAEAKTKAEEIRQRAQEQADAERAKVLEQASVEAERVRTTPGSSYAPHVAPPTTRW